MSYYANVQESLWFKTADAAQRFCNEMKTLGYQPSVDEDHDRNVFFEDSRLRFNYDIEHLLTKYAKEMDEGSYMGFVGEDGESWRYLISDGKMYEVDNTDILNMIVWKDKKFVGIAKGETPLMIRNALIEKHIDFDEVMFIKDCPSLI